jgi:hypothetical protein
MKDFQVFGLIKKHLNEKMKDQAIYFTSYQEMKKPCCVIELEEFWSNTLPLKKSVKTLIKFKTTCFSNDDLLSTQVDLSQRLVNLLDGLNLELEDKNKATVKHSQTLITAPGKATPQSVSQMFEAIIREV